MALGNFVNDPLINDFTIRSRPWKGQESKVWATGAWIPSVGGTTCSDVANLQIPIGSASLTVPIHRCENLEALPNATEHSMALDWDGWTADQRFLDFAFDVYAPNTIVVPVYADYSWANVNSCVNLSECPINEAANLKDPRW
jgi:hypothetical protein